MVKSNDTQKTLMAESTHSILTVKGFTPEQPLKVRKTIVESERGIKYTLDITNSKTSASFQIDGNIIKEGPRCDKLVLVKLNQTEWGEVFVELKGVDVTHAIKQLRETLNNKLFFHPTNKIVRARIVATSFPSNKSNPIMEAAKKEFRALPSKCDLRSLKNGQRDNI